MICRTLSLGPLFPFPTQLCLVYNHLCQKPQLSFVFYRFCQKNKKLNCNKIILPTQHHNHHHHRHHLRHHHCNHCHHHHCHPHHRLCHHDHHCHHHDHHLWLYDYMILITMMKETAPGLLVYTLISPPQQGDLFITRWEIKFSQVLIMFLSQVFTSFYQVFFTSREIRRVELVAEFLSRALRTFLTYLCSHRDIIINTKSSLASEKWW